MSTQFSLFKVSKPVEEIVEELRKIAPRLHVQKTDENSTEIQIFDLSVGKVFRVLECGYGLRNILWEMEEQYPCIFYDSRASDYDQELEDLGDETDKAIKEGKYKVYDVTGDLEL